MVSGIDNHWQYKNPYKWRRCDTLSWLKSWSKNKYMDQAELEKLLNIIPCGRILCELNFSFFIAITTTHGLDIYEDLQLLISSYLSHDNIELTNKKSYRPKGLPKLWEYLLDLLYNSSYNPEIIFWIDERKGIFGMKKPEKVAKLWGNLTRNEKMNYDKMSRTLRYYYVKNILKHHRNPYSYIFGSKINNLRRKKELNIEENLE